MWCLSLANMGLGNQAHIRRPARDARARKRHLWASEPCLPVLALTLKTSGKKPLMISSACWGM